jgi:hypothetical protein
MKLGQSGAVTCVTTRCTIGVKPQRRSAFALPAVFDDAAKHVCPKVVGLYMVLIAANLLAWAWAFTAFHDYPLLLATALIA